jgi:hypothetical protein
MEAEEYVQVVDFFTKVTLAEALETKYAPTI